MPTIDTPLRVARVPGQNRSQDEYRLPGSRPAATEPHVDATGPGIQAPPAPPARRGHQASGPPEHNGPDSSHAGRSSDATVRKPGSNAPVRITGRIFALRDGSGYAALGSDGNYYRVQGGGGRGLAYARRGGFVDASMVNVAGGPVSAVELGTGETGDPGAVRAPDRPDAAAANAGSSTERPARAEPDASDTALPDIRQATDQSHATRQLIAEHPRTAMRSQANVPPKNAISLLR